MFARCQSWPPANHPFNESARLGVFPRRRVVSVRFVTDSEVRWPRCHPRRRCSIRVRPMPGKARTGVSITCGVHERRVDAARCSTMIVTPGDGRMRRSPQRRHHPGNAQIRYRGALALLRRPARRRAILPRLQRHGHDGQRVGVRPLGPPVDLQRRGDPHGDRRTRRLDRAPASVVGSQPSRSSLGSRCSQSRGPGCRASGLGSSPCPTRGMAATRHCSSRCSRCRSS